MKARLKLESLDDRIVPSTVAFGDINNDGLVDKAALTGNRTVTISLANAIGSYTVSATLTAPNGPSLEHVQMSDIDSDGDLDVNAFGSSSSWIYGSTWMGNNDGTFGAPTSGKYKIPKNFF